MKSTKDVRFTIYITSGARSDWLKYHVLSEPGKSEDEAFLMYFSDHVSCKVAANDMYRSICWSLLDRHSTDRRPYRPRVDRQPTKFIGRASTDVDRCIDRDITGSLSVNCRSCIS